MTTFSELTDDQRAAAEQLAADNLRMVLEEFGPFCRRQVKDWSQRELLERIESDLEQQLLYSWHSPLQLPYYSAQAPMLVCEVFSDDRAVAASVGVACLVYSVGVNLLDDVLDGDRSRFGKGVDEGAATLLGVTSVAALTQAAILEAPVPAAAKLRAIKALTNGSLKIAGGQALEMRSQERMTPRLALSIAEKKTGEGIAALCRVGAILGGVATAAERETWATYGFHLATARQLASDLHDFCDVRRGRDLKAGRVSYPGALMLAQSRGAERRKFLALLAEARTSAAAKQAVRNMGREAGVVAATQVVVERHLREAAAAMCAEPKPAHWALAGLVEPRE